MLAAGEDSYEEAAGRILEAYSPWLAPPKERPADPQATIRSLDDMYRRYKSAKDGVK